MIRRFIGPLLLLAALVVGDQIRIHRPDHKFRLIVEVDTQAGVRTASHVYSVHPDRGYVQGNSTTTKGDAIALEIGGKPLVVLMAHENEGRFDLQDISFVAVRAFAAAGQRAAFRTMDRVKGAAPVTGSLLPLMATFVDPGKPETMRPVQADRLAETFGAGVALRRVAVEIVPNGYWPLDLGGATGEPVTRDILKTLPWAKAPDAAATALKAAGWEPPSQLDAVRAFTR